MQRWLLGVVGSDTEFGETFAETFLRLIEQHRKHAKIVRSNSQNPAIEVLAEHLDPTEESLYNPTVLTGEPLDLVEIDRYTLGCGAGAGCLILRKQLNNRDTEELS
jgi:hypothetical protein